MRALFLAALAAFLAVPALAQPVCMAAAALEEVLGSRYGEHAVGMGLAGERVLVMLYVNPESGSFTVVTVGAGGSACILALGQDWSPIEPPAPGEDG